MPEPVVNTYQPVPQIQSGKASELLSSFSSLLGNAGQVVKQQEQNYEQTIQALQANQQTSYSNCVATGKRKEIIAMLNAMYEAGLVKDISKAEFFKRQAMALGDPGIEEYSTPLSQVVQSNKYEDIFDNVTSAGIEYREKSDNKQ